MVKEIEYIFATTTPPNQGILWSSQQNDPPNPNFDPGTLVMGAIISGAPAFTLFMDYDSPPDEPGSPNFTEVSYSIPDTQGEDEQWVVWTETKQSFPGQYQARWRSSEFGSTTIPFTIGVEPDPDEPDPEPNAPDQETVRRILWSFRRLLWRRS